MSDIDREIAEKVMENFWNDGWTQLDADGQWVRVPYGYPDDPSDYPMERWSPSTRIDHAWEVVEKLRQDGYTVDMCSEQGTYEYWEIIVDREDGTLLDPIVSRKATAPLAICRAALEAVK